MPFFRQKPLHLRLAEDAGFDRDGEERETATGHPADLEEEYFGERSLPFWERLSGEVVNARPRRWDAVVTAEADVEGDEVGFVSLPDGTLLVEEQVGDATLEPLARAVEQRLRPPYRARGVRRGGRVWAVSATRIRVDEFRAEGDELELAVTDLEATLLVDGTRSFGSVPALERIGEAEGSTFVVRAARLEGDLWEVHSHAL